MKYRQFNYITAEPLIAEIKEELKSYFDAGAVSEIMLPTYVDQCLRKLKYLPLKPEDAVIVIENFVSRLPEDFFLLDYAVTYDTNQLVTGAIPTTTGYYFKSLECSGTCDTNCFPDCDPKYEVFEKITIPSQLGFNRIEMVKPRWIRVYYGATQFCVSGCPNLSKKSKDTMTIHDRGSVSTNFQKGCVYIRYFSRPLDDNNIPMIPEQIEIEEYIKSHMKFKLFEQLMNSVVDETFNQVKYKFEYYKQDSLNKLQACWVLLQPTKQQMADNVARIRNRFTKYHIE